MTRKDYVLIADAVAQSRAAVNIGDITNPQHAISRVIDELTAKLESDNPNFDAERFIAACNS